MSCPFQSQNTFERIQAHRAAGDMKGLAELLIDGGLPKEERQEIRLTRQEAMAYLRLKHERGLAGRQGRIRRKQQVAYDRLCGLRHRGDTYRILQRLRDGDDYDEAVITGVGLMPGVPRFELTEEEAEAVRLREQSDGLSEWRLVRAGEYRSNDWKWYLNRRGGQGWYVYRDGELWGRWDKPLRWDGNPHTKLYRPFRKLREAMGTVESYWDDDGD